MIEPIVNYVSAFCDMDPYSAKEPDNYYRINSLYLDSPNSLFYERKKQGMGKRFNMRIRSYGSKPVAPYFYELKAKEMGFVKKYRAPTSLADWQQAQLDDLASDHSDKEKLSSKKNLRLFINAAVAHNVEPKLLTTYKRMAFASRLDEYARVTFDRHLAYQETNEYIVSPDMERLVPYDHSLIFPDGCCIILELKSTTRLPMWMLDLISKFELTRTGFSKYCNSFEAYRMDYYEHPIGLRTGLFY